MCINVCGIQDNILKHGFLLASYVLKLESSYIKFIPCGFFALIFFFTVFSFLLSIFGQVLFFLSNESKKKKIVSSLLIYLFF